MDAIQTKLPLPPHKICGDIHDSILSGLQSKPPSSFAISLLLSLYRGVLQLLSTNYNVDYKPWSSSLFHACVGAEVGIVLSDYVWWLASHKFMGWDLIRHPDPIMDKRTDMMPRWRRMVMTRLWLMLKRLANWEEYYFSMYSVSTLVKSTEFQFYRNGCAGGLL